MAIVQRNILGLSPSPPPFQPFDPSVESLHLDSLQIKCDLTKSQEKRNQKNDSQTDAYIRVHASSDPISDPKNVTKWSDSSTAKGSGTEYPTLTVHDGQIIQNGEDPSSSQSEKSKNKASLPVGSVEMQCSDDGNSVQQTNTAKKLISQKVEIGKKVETETKRKKVTLGLTEEYRPQKRINNTQECCQFDVETPSEDFLKQKEKSRTEKDKNHNNKRPDQLKIAPDLKDKKIAPARKIANDDITAPSATKFTCARESSTKRPIEHQKEAKKLQSINNLAPHKGEKNICVKAHQAPVQIPKNLSNDVVMMNDKAEQHAAMQDIQDDYPLEYVDDSPEIASPSKILANLKLGNKRQEAKSSVSPSHDQQGDMVVSTTTEETERTKLRSKHDKKTSDNDWSNSTRPSASSGKSKKVDEAERLRRLEDRRFGVFHSDEESTEGDVVEFVSIRNNSAKVSSSAEKASSIVKFEEHPRPRPVPRKRSNTQNSADTVDSITQSTKSTVPQKSDTANRPSTKRKDASSEFEKPGAKKSRKNAPYRARHSVLDGIKTPDMNENRSLADSAMLAYGFATSTKKITSNVPTKEVRDIEKRNSDQIEEPKDVSIDDNYDLGALLDRKAKDLILDSTNSLKPLEDEQKEDGEISSAIDSDSESPAAILNVRAKSKKGVFKPKANTKRLIKTDEALQLLPGQNLVRKDKKAANSAATDRKLQFRRSHIQSPVTSRIGVKKLLPNGTSLSPVDTRRKAEAERMTTTAIDRSDHHLPPASTRTSQLSENSTVGTNTYRRAEKDGKKASTSALESASSPLTDISDREPTKSSEKTTTKTSTTIAREKVMTQKRKGRSARKSAIEASDFDAQKENDDDLYMVPPGKPLKKTTKRPLRGKKAQQNGALSPAILHENNELKAKFFEVDSYNIPEEKV